jgi:diphosphomevalonate decarboxylase
MWLNAVEIELNGRLVTCLREVRKIATDKIDPTTGEVLVKKEDWPNYRVHISSLNTFPTGAGMNEVELVYRHGQMMILSID